jgi:rubrerythrin
MGRMFFSLGLLPCDDVIEISASDLVTGYVGQAGGKTLDVLTKARGKVLFIDEAYQLNPQQGGSYMQEVVDEIVKCLTSEDFKGKMIVILAGYDKDMNAMLSVNQGLRSRFPAKLLFEDFSVELIMELLTLRLAVYDLEVATAVVKELPNIAAEIKAMPFFANGRDIDTIAKSAFRNYAVRVGGKGEPVIEVCDIRLAMETLLSTKVSLDTITTPGPSMVIPSQQQQNAFNHAIPPAPPVTTVATAAAIATETQQHEEEEKNYEEKDTSHELPAPEVTEFTIKLQDLLDQMGLNNQEGVRGLSLLALDSKEMISLAEQLSKMLNVAPESAIEMLSDWQHVQAEVQELLEAQEKEKKQAKLMKRKSMIPIWRCAVCGAGRFSIFKSIQNQVKDISM